MSGLDHSGEGERPPTRPLETTASLLARVRQGDVAARERLLGRFLPALERWAHGRLPYRARDLAETDDLVQNTLLRALDHLNGFEPRREGAFLAYLRRILLNQVRDEIRRVGRRPVREDLQEDLPGRAPSQLEEAIGLEALEQYETALERLTEKQHEAIVLKIELGYSYDEVAEAMDLASANAARMLVTRGLIRLAEEMEGEHAKEEE
jgi:RNA polymerase sigma factor (sigma-70 family)